MAVPNDLYELNGNKLTFKIRLSCCCALVKSTQLLDGETQEQAYQRGLNKWQDITCPTHLTGKPMNN
jgi:hypothetical protein